MTDCGGVVVVAGRADVVQVLQRCRENPFGAGELGRVTVPTVGRGVGGVIGDRAGHDHERERAFHRAVRVAEHPLGACGEGREPELVRGRADSSRPSAMKVAARYHVSSCTGSSRCPDTAMVRRPSVAATNAAKLARGMGCTMLHRLRTQPR